MIVEPTGQLSTCILFVHATDMNCSRALHPTYFSNRCCRVSWFISWKVIKNCKNKTTQSCLFTVCLLCPILHAFSLHPNMVNLKWYPSYYSYCTEQQKKINENSASQKKICPKFPQCIQHQLSQLHEQVVFKLTHVLTIVHDCTRSWNQNAWALINFFPFQHSRQLQEHYLKTSLLVLFSTCC